MSQPQKQAPLYPQPTAPAQPYTYPPTGYQHQQIPPKGDQPVYIQPGHQAPVYIVQQNSNDCGGTPVGMILFIVGFFCAVSWWVGACCYPARGQITEREKLWRRLNIIMTVISVILIVVGIVLYIVMVATVVSAASSIGTNNTRR